MCEILDQKYIDQLKDEITTRFNTNEMMVAFCDYYLKYLLYRDNEFVIDFENVWRYLGYSRKENARTLFLNNMEIDRDYKVTSNIYRVEIIHLTCDAFNRFCMLAGTQKAREIRNCYILIDKLFLRLICEQKMEYNNIIRNLQEAQKNARLEGRIIGRIGALLEAYDKKNVVYIGYVLDNVVKFGHTNDIQRRSREHLRDYGRFELIHVIDTGYVDNRKVEEKMKDNEYIKLNKYTEGQWESKRELVKVDKVVTVNVIRDIAKQCLESFGDVRVLDMSKVELVKAEGEAERAKAERLKIELELEKFKSQQDMCRTDRFPNLPHSFSEEE